MAIQEKTTPAYPRFFEWPNIFLIIIGLFVMLSAISFFLCYDHNKNATEKYRLKDETVASLISLAVEEHFSKIIKTMESYGNRRLLIRAIQDRKTGQIKKHMVSMMEIDAGIDSLTILDSQGRHLASLPEHPEMIEKNFARHEVYKAIDKGRKPYLSDIIEKTPGKKDLVILICIPVFDEKGSIISIMGNTIKVLDLNRIVSYLSFDPDSSVSIIDRKGRVAFSSRYTFDKEITVYPFHAEISKSKKEGNKSIIIDKPYPGTSKLYVSFFNIAGTDWTALVDRESKKIFISEINHYVYIAGMMFLIFLLLALLLLLLRKTIISQKYEEQLKILRELEIHEIRFRELFNTMSSCVAIYKAVDNGDNFILKDFNRAAEETEHVRREDIIGKAVAEVFPGVREFGIFEVFTRVWKTGKHEYFPETLYRDAKDPGSWRENWVYKLPSDEIVAVYNDITQHKMAEEEIRRNEKKYRTIFENAVMGIFQTTPEGEYLSINQAFASMFGFASPEEMMQSIRDIGNQLYVNPGDRERLKEILAERGIVRGFEAQLYRKDRSRFWISINAHAVHDDTGNILYLEGTNEDITERKNAEEALLKSEEKEKRERLKFHTLTENAPFGMVLIEANGNFTYMNPAFRDVFGYDLQDVPDGKTWFRKAYPDPEYRHTVISTWLEDSKKIVSGKVRPETFTVMCKNGTEKIISFLPVQLETGVQIMSCEDITERSKITQLIEESRTVLRLLIDAVMETLLMIDGNGKILVLNKTGSQRLGKDIKDLIGTSFYGYFHPELAAIIAGKVDSAFHNRRMVFFEHEVTGRTYMTFIYPVTDDKKNPERAVLFSADVTRHRQTQRNLEESEKKYRSIFENAVEGIFQSTHDGRFISVNPAAARIHGFDSPEDMINSVNDIKTQIFVSQEQRKEYIRLIKERGRIENFESEMYRKDGGRIWTSMNVRAVRDDIGNILYYEGIINDITERKRSETALAESRKKMNAIAAGSTIPQFAIDKDHNVIIWNKALEIYSGIKSEDMLGTSNHWTAFYDKQRPCLVDLVIEGFREDDIHKWYDRIIKSNLIEGAYEAADFYSKIKGGVWLRFTAVIVRDSSGDIVAGIETLDDITSLMDVEASLRASEEKYRSIFENTFEGIFQSTPDGRFLSANTAMAHMYGFETPEEMIDSVNDIAHELYVNPEKREWVKKEVAEKGFIKDFEVERYRKDKTRFWVSMNTRAVYDKDKNVLYYEGTAEDITRRMLVEERIREMLLELESKNEELKKTYDELKESQTKIIQSEKMASIGQLAAGVAHEINNPTGFVISNLYSLKKYMERLNEFYNLQENGIRELSMSGTKEQEIVLDRIKTGRKSLKIDFIREDAENLIRESIDGAERIKKIVLDLKSFSHVDDTAFKMADIHDILETTLNIVWNELKYKADLKKDYGKIPMTRCNPGQLSQVFMNLLVNAAQAMDKFGEITIRTWHDNNHIYVSISDTGCGISDRNLKKLFEPFFTTKEIGKGTGLGLSIAYDIIKKHDGEILVVSKTNKGTIFTIKVPIKEAVDGSGNDDITGRR